MKLNWMRGSVPQQKRLKWALALLAIGAIGHPADASTLLGISKLPIGTMVAKINLATGVINNAGPGYLHIGDPNSPYSYGFSIIAFGPDGNLYGVTSTGVGSFIATIDPATGVINSATPGYLHIGDPSSPYSYGFGGITFGSDGTLYGITETVAGSFVARIDLATGVINIATPGYLHIGDPNSPYSYAFSDIAFGMDGNLYGITKTVAGSFVARIDLATGVINIATPGYLHIGDPNSPYSYEFSGIAFDSGGTLYGVTKAGIGSYIARIDLATGVINNAGPGYLHIGNPNSPYSYAFSDIAFAPEASVGGVPEPASWGMMIVGFGAIGISLRRRPLARVA